MRISINLSSHPYTDIEPLIKRLRTALIVLGGVTVCLIVLLLVSRARQNTARAEAHLLDKTIESESRELTSYKSMMQRPDVVLLADRTSALNRLFDEKSFSWTILMKDLEDVFPAQVQMATIQPIRAKDGSISLQIHFQGPRVRAIEFVENLERSPRFGQPHIARESTQGDSHATEQTTALSDNSIEEFEIAAGYDADQTSIPAPSDNAPDHAALQAANAPPSPALAEGAPRAISHSVPSVRGSIPAGGKP